VVAGLPPEMMRAMIASQLDSVDAQVHAATIALAQLQTARVHAVVFTTEQGARVEMVAPVAVVVLLSHVCWGLGIDRQATWSAVHERYEALDDPYAPLPEGPDA